MGVSFRVRLTIIYTALFILFGAVLIAVVAAVLNRLLDAGSLRAIPDVFENRTIAELRSLDMSEIVREARLAERERLRRASVRVVFVVFVLLSIAGAGVAWMLAGQVIRPIRTITAHARAASASTLSDHIDLKGPRDELKELATTYDALLTRLEAAFRSQRHFSANVSHELRTPLAVARAEADVLLANPGVSERERRFASRVRAMVIRNEELIDALLFFSRAESRMVGDGIVDLSAVVGDAVGALASQADRAEVRLELSIDDTRVRGDELLLGRMVSNLVQNAILHNEPEGWVTVELSSTPAQARLAIANGGRLVGESESLFEPFETGEGAGSGVGLGLAIAREAVIAHDGTISAEARADGGLHVTVVLPSIPSDVQAR